MITYKVIDAHDHAIVQIRGSLTGDEESTLNELAKRLATRPARFLLKDLRAMNTRGIAAWAHFVKGLDAPFQYAECPVFFVDCINLFAEAHGKGVVVSFFAPLRCPACRKSET